MLRVASSLYSYLASPLGELLLALMKLLFESTVVTLTFSIAHNILVLLLVLVLALPLALLLLLFALLARPALVLAALELLLRLLLHPRVLLAGASVLLLLPLIELLLSPALRLAELQLGVLPSAWNRQPDGDYEEGESILSHGRERNG